MPPKENREAKLIGRFIADSLPYVLLLTSKLGFVLLPIICTTLLFAASALGLLGGISCVYLHGIEEIELRCRERRMNWISYIGHITTIYALLSNGWILTASSLGAVITFGFFLRVISLVKVRRIETELSYD